MNTYNLIGLVLGSAFMLWYLVSGLSVLWQVTRAFIYDESLDDYKRRALYAKHFKNAPVSDAGGYAFIGFLWFLMSLSMLILWPPFLLFAVGYACVIGARYLVRTKKALDTLKDHKHDNPA